jgi:hypothetical protein
MGAPSGHRAAAGASQESYPPPGAQAPGAPPALLRDRRIERPAAVSASAPARAPAPPRDRERDRPAAVVTAAAAAAAALCAVRGARARRR